MDAATWSQLGWSSVGVQPWGSGLARMGRILILPLDATGWRRPRRRSVRCGITSMSSACLVPARGFGRFASGSGTALVRSRMAAMVWTATGSIPTARRPASVATSVVQWPSPVFCQSGSPRRRLGEGPHGSILAGNHVRKGVTSRRKSTPNSEWCRLDAIPGGEGFPCLEAARRRRSRTGNRVVAERRPRPQPEG